MPTVYSLSPIGIWRYLLTQKASFWFICLYLFFEYVRPQALFPAIDVLPWARTLILLALGSYLLESGTFSARSSINQWLFVYGAVVIVSTITAVYPDVSVANYGFFFTWVLIYFLICNIVVSEQRFVIFMLAFLLYNVQMSWGAVKQWASFGFGFRTWGVTGGAGWFNNSGEFGIAMCIFLPLTLCFAWGLKPQLSKAKFWTLIAFATSALMGIIASSSRGAILGAAAAAFTVLLKTRYRVRGLIGLAVVGTLVFVALPAEQKARFTSAGDDKSSVSRLTYWRRGVEMTKENPVLGIGYYNWLRYYQQTYDIKGQLPHNIFIQASAELGVTGLAVFIALIVATFAVNRRSRALASRDPPEGRFIFMMAHGFDLALVGYLVSGFFVTVLYYPFFWINLAMTAALYEVARRKFANALPAVRVRSRGQLALTARGQLPS